VDKEMVGCHYPGLGTGNIGFFCILPDIFYVYIFYIIFIGDSGIDKMPMDMKGEGIPGRIPVNKRCQI